MNKVRVTEYLDIDLERETWCCHRCNGEIISAREPYWKGCLVYERAPSDIYGAPIEIAKDSFVSYCPHPDFVRVIEFYCPSCGIMVEVQYLPPGHPIPVDIEIDIDKLKEKVSK